MSAKLDAILRLALDARTPENEAITALRFYRKHAAPGGMETAMAKSAPVKKEEPGREFTITNVGVKWYRAVFHWGYAKAAKLGLEKFQITMVATAKRPTYAEISNIVFTFEGNAGITGIFEEELNKLIVEMTAKNSKPGR